MNPLQNYLYYSLFHFLISGVGAWVENASGQVLDQTDSLCNANLLLLSELGSQTTLPRVGMVHGRWLCALLDNNKQ